MYPRRGVKSPLSIDPIASPGEWVYIAR